MPAILDHNGRPMPTASERRQADVVRRARARLSASYDAAQTTSENENHWSAADGLSAAKANSPEIRNKLRRRARYECDNNCYASGMLQVLALHTVGTGPRLQLQSPFPEANAAVEQAFAAWAMRSRLARKLRTARIAKAKDGESLLVRVNNPRLADPVKLDLWGPECDQLTSPIDRYSAFPDDRYDDGITLDEFGNPVKYDILKHHPGDGTFGGGRYGLDSRSYNADDVIHLFREDRPGQRRGVPEILPALPLFSQLRRYEMAVLAAAETAADFSAVMYTDNPAMDPDDIPNLSSDEPLEITKRMFQILPNGWKMAQLRAEQPTAQFKDFRAAIIAEAARCILMPYNVAAGDSSDMNYSSGRLDHQTYFRAVAVDRNDLEIEALTTKIFPWWLDEAARLAVADPDYRLPIIFDAGRLWIVGDDQILPFNFSWVHWQWDGFEHVDPAKESNAADTRIKGGTWHRALDYSRQGLDIDAEDGRAAASYGVSIEEYRQALFRSHFQQPGPTANPQLDAEPLSPPTEQSRRTHALKN